MRVLQCLPLALTALLASAASPRKYVGKRNNGSGGSPFVSTDGGQFIVNGSALKFVGTTAYWLPTLNTEQDIIDTISNMSARGLKVVRTWAFNDVETVPENGTWFQLVSNGTTTINDGPNGLQKLDKVIDIAEQHGMYVLLSLTNNWNPRPLLDNLTDFGNLSLSRRDITPGTNNSHPRNFLSNDYGGMDVYVRQFGVRGHHDEFYTNQTILDIFKNYTTQIVSRYANRTSVFAWELANDPRCNSSVAASPTCTAQTVTRWHSDVAQHVKSVDPNHLVASGHQGFFCVDCPKLFPRTSPPPPQTSPAPGQRRRSIPPPLTKARILKQRRLARKRSRQLKREAGQLSGSPVRIRGNWVATPTRRQDEQGVGPAFDGSQGVDSEDIINIPQIGFGSFQLFPDQNQYGVDDPNLSPFENTVQQGLDWIQAHADTAAQFGKPVSLTGFGLVTQENSPFFTPFNTSTAPFAGDTGSEQPAQQPSSQQSFGITDQQRDQAYGQWVDAGISAGLQGIIQYQWGQGNYTAQTGTTISPANTESGQSPNSDETGQSPNDGYSTQGVGQSSVLDILGQAAQSFGST